jgi:hypothetical protein
MFHKRAPNTAAGYPVYNALCMYTYAMCTAEVDCFCDFCAETEQIKVDAQYARPTWAVVAQERVEYRVCTSVNVAAVAGRENGEGKREKEKNCKTKTDWIRTYRLMPSIVCSRSPRDATRTPSRNG